MKVYHAHEEFGMIVEDGGEYITLVLSCDQDPYMIEEKHDISFDDSITLPDCDRGVSEWWMSLLDTLRDNNVTQVNDLNLQMEFEGTPLMRDLNDNGVYTLQEYDRIIKKAWQMFGE